VLQVAEKLL